MNSKLHKKTVIACFVFLSQFLFNGFVSAADTKEVTQLLPPDIKKHLTKLQIPPESVSLYVKHIDNDKPLVSWNIDAIRNPASVMKIVTTFAALSEMGPGYQWDTDVRRTGLVRNGVLDGDLIIIGRGNPFFVKHDLWSLVNHLENRGIRSVAGDLIIDDTYFDLPDHDPGEFDGEGYRPYNAGPAAMLFNFSTMDFYLVPKQGGKKVEVRNSPAPKGIKIVSDINQTRASCRGSKIKLRMNVEEEPEQHVVRFSGTYPEKCGRYQLTRSVVPSHELMYGTLVSLIEERGGTFQGSLLTGKDPSDSGKLFTMSSKTLAEVIRSTNKFSNNVMSRQLFLTLGAEKLGAPATLEKSRTAIKRVLGEQGVDMPSLEIINGSGLCRECAVSARGLMSLLEAAWRSNFMPEFLASLPVPGVDGGLKKRFPKGRYKGQVHMKTGTIDHVSAAAGIAQSKQQGRYLFVILINHNNVHKGKGQAFQRRLMGWLMDLEAGHPGVSLGQ